MSTIRKCKKCGLNKPLTEFGAHSSGYRHECKHCMRLRMHEWETTNHERKNEIARASYYRLKEKGDWWERRKANRRVGNGNTYAARVREEVFAHYGGNKCMCCGETEPMFLSIDHINNDGHIHRRTITAAKSIYQWLKARGYPPGFQVLCINCNLGKAKNGGICPHKSRQEGPETIAKASTLK